jgi:hypothetical protein
MRSSLRRIGLIPYERNLSHKGFDHYLCQNYDTMCHWCGPANGLSVAFQLLALCLQRSNDSRSSASMGCLFGEPNQSSPKDSETIWTLFNFKMRRPAKVAIPRERFDDTRRENVIGELSALAIDNCSHPVPVPSHIGSEKWRAAKLWQHEWVSLAL